MKRFFAALLSLALCLALCLFVRNESDTPILHVALKDAGEQDAADQIDHAIFDFQIIVVNGRHYFAFVRLNVNWWDPCTLYEYDGGLLRELAQWDNMRLMSIGLI